MGNGLILTAVGAAAIELAYQAGDVVTISVVAFGDGGGAAVTPEPGITGLANKFGEAPFTQGESGSGMIAGQAVINARDYPGKVLREFGLVSSDGVLIAYGAYPDTYLPELADSVVKELVVNFAMPLVHAESVVLEIDPNISVLTIEEGDRRYLRITESLSEIEKSGDMAQASARGHLGITALGLGGGPQHKTDAFNEKNSGYFFRINATSANRPGNNSYGGLALPIDGVPTAGYVLVGADLSLWVGQSTTQEKGVTWARVYTTLFKPTPADINAVDKSGDTMTGDLKNSAEFQSTSGNNFRIASGTIGSFWRNDGTAIFLMLTNEGDPFGDFNSLRPFSVDLRTGTAAFGNGVHLAGEWPAITTATGTTWHPDGNVQGSVWGGYLSNWLNTNIANAQNNAQNWAYQNLVQGVRLSGRTIIADTGGHIDLPSGCVFTGMSGANYDPNIWASYSAVQVLINGQWATIGTV